MHPVATRHAVILPLLAACAGHATPGAEPAPDPERTLEVEAFSIPLPDSFGILQPSNAESAWGAEVIQNVWDSGGAWVARIDDPGTYIVVSLLEFQFSLPELGDSASCASLTEQSAAVRGNAPLASRVIRLPYGPACQAVMRAATPARLQIETVRRWGDGMLLTVCQFHETDHEAGDACEMVVRGVRLPEGTLSPLESVDGRPLDDLPELRSCGPLQFPRQAREPPFPIERGEVLMGFVIDTTGAVDSASAVRSTDAVFVDAATAFVRSCRFSVMTVDGVPVRVRMELSVPFEEQGAEGRGLGGRDPNRLSGSKSHST